MTCDIIGVGYPEQDGAGLGTRREKRVSAFGRGADSRALDVWQVTETRDV